MPYFCRSWFNGNWKDMDDTCNIFLFWVHYKLLKYRLIIIDFFSSKSQSSIYHFSSFHESLFSHWPIFQNSGIYCFLLSEFCAQLVTKWSMPSISSSLTSSWIHKYMNVLIYFYVRYEPIDSHVRKHSLAVASILYLWWLL